LGVVQLVKENSPLLTTSNILTKRMVASIAVFISVYNHCFHHEMDFLSLGT